MAPSALASSRDDGRGSASACDVTFAPSEAGIVKVDMVDRGRAGGAMILKVDGLDYRAMFASDGRLSLSVPRLSRTPALVWTRADGTLCRQVATAPAVNMPLQIALIWGGAGNLDMHVVEPNAWIGSPRGHLHADQPNIDGATANGRFSAFGAPGDPTRVQLYAVDRSLLGDSGVLNVIVKLAASDGASCVNAGEPPQLRYEIQIRHVDAQGDNVRPESRSFAFELPPCAGSSGGAERFERLTVKF